MKGKYYGFFIFFILFAGCLQGKKDKKINQNMEELEIIVKDSTESLLLRQLKAGSGTSGVFGEYTNYVITEHDFNITQNIIDSLLMKSGLRKNDFENFKSRIKEVFKVEIHRKEIIHLYLLKSYRLTKENPYVQDDDLYTIDEGISDFVFHLDGNHFILSKTIHLPNLIDYQKIYPDIARVEERIPTKIDLGGDELSILHRWKDLDLKQTRELNIKDLYHKNAFLFNRNNASLTWLLLNNKPFLTGLLRTFGYDKEHRINQLVLEETYEYYTKYVDDFDRIKYTTCEDLFFSRDSQNRLQINKGVFETISNLTTSDDLRYLTMLYKFLKIISTGDYQTDLTDEEKVELFCYFGRMEIDLHKKYLTSFKWDKPHSGISGLLCDYEYQEIAKKHKYWGIPKFYEIEQVVEWEYPIVNDGENKESFDYSTLK